MIRYHYEIIPDFGSWICSYVRFYVLNSVFCRFLVEICILEKTLLEKSCLKSNFTSTYQISTRSVNYYRISCERGCWAEIWQRPVNTQNPIFRNHSLLVVEQKLLYRWKAIEKSYSNLQKNLNFDNYFLSYSEKSFFLFSLI